MKVFCLGFVFFFFSLSIMNLDNIVLENIRQTSGLVQTNKLVIIRASSFVVESSFWFFDDDHALDMLFNTEKTVC